ncbi:MAG: DUF6476 family protein [Methyloligellaceae bacterium]
MTSNGNNKTNNSSAPQLSPAQLRLLKIVVSVTGIFLVLGFIGLASVLVYKITTPQQTVAYKKSVKPVQSSVQLPEGAIVKSVSMGNDLLSVHISRQGKDEILVIEAGSGRILNHIVMKGN